MRIHLFLYKPKFTTEVQKNVVFSQSLAHLCMFHHCVQPNINFTVLQIYLPPLFTNSSSLGCSKKPSPTHFRQLLLWTGKTTTDSTSSQWWHFISWAVSFTLNWFCCNWSNNNFSTCTLMHLTISSKQSNLSTLHYAWYSDMIQSTTLHNFKQVLTESMSFISILGLCFLFK